MTTTSQPSAAAPAPSIEQWQQRHFRAMNTHVETVVYSEGADVIADIETLFRQAEQRMSRFLPDSELSQLNAASSAPQTISPALFAVIETALWAAQQSGGLYDPTILADLETAGYDRSFEYVVQRDGFAWMAPADTLDATGRRRASYADIVIDPAAFAVTKPASVRIDLGGIGKGWTVDRAAERLLGAEAFLVNAGGDLYAHGRPGHPRGWRVTIEHPLRRTHWIARLFIDHAGLATSTTMKRRWTVNGRSRHHLIDPRTGQPAITDALSVTVIAPRTVTAELLAKVALLLGADAGLAYLTATANVEGLIYTADGCVLTTPGLAAVLDAVEPDGMTN